MDHSVSYIATTPMHAHIEYHRYNTLEPASPLIVLSSLDGPTKSGIRLTFAFWGLKISTVPVFHQSLDQLQLLKLMGQGSVRWPLHNDSIRQ